MENKAVILTSGGLDSSVTLYLAKSQGYMCFPLAFDYGQRHKRELSSAKAISASLGLDLVVVKIHLPWLSSSLIDKNRPLLPKGENIPETYVSGRNIIFLSIGISYSESIGASSLFIGANVRDFSGYPDCTEAFLESFFQAAAKGTKAGFLGRPIKIERPLINKTKKEIVLLGKELGVPFEKTWSCYNGGKIPCTICESCIFRKKGFSEAGLPDPLQKVKNII